MNTKTEIRQKNYTIRKITKKSMYTYIFYLVIVIDLKCKTTTTKPNKTKQKTYIVRKPISRIPKINRYWNQMKIARVQTTTTKYLNEIVRSPANKIHSFTLDDSDGIDSVQKR